MGFNAVSHLFQVGFGGLGSSLPGMGDGILESIFEELFNQEK
jgi:hypothetical protein